jgi:DNA modification methylase
LHDRKFIGCEIDDEYYNKSVERIESYFYHNALSNLLCNACYNSL